MLLTTVGNWIIFAFFSACLKFVVEGAEELKLHLSRFTRAGISSVNALCLQSADSYFNIRDICNSNLNALLCYYNSYFSHAQQWYNFALKPAVSRPSNYHSMGLLLL